MAVLSVPAPSMRFYEVLWVSIFPPESFQNLPRFSFLGNPGLFHVLPWYSMRFYGIPWLSPIFPLLLSTFPHIYPLFPTYSLFFPIISCVFPMFPWHYSHRTLCFMPEIMLKLLNSISVCDTGSCGSWLCSLCHKYQSMLHYTQESSLEGLASLPRLFRTMSLWTWWLV